MKKLLLLLSLIIFLMAGTALAQQHSSTSKAAPTSNTAQKEDASKSEMPAAHAEGEAAVTGHTSDESVARPLEMEPIAEHKQPADEANQEKK